MRANTIRLYVEQRLEAGLDAACTRLQANYLVNVMRLADGAEILVFDGRNGEWRASLVRHRRRHLMLAEQTTVRIEKPAIVCQVWLVDDRSDSLKSRHPRRPSHPDTNHAKTRLLWRCLVID